MNIELEEELSNDNDFLMNLPDLKSTEEIKDTTLPAKSKEVYEKAYNEFRTWANINGIKVYTENVLLAYFSEKSKIRKASSLWVNYSMLKATLNIYHKVDIGKYKRVLAFLKLQFKSYSPKKSKVLTKEQVTTFLSEAPDSKYLMVKVALIFGIAGAGSRQLTEITLDDIQDLGTSILITIRESKTKIKHACSIIDDGEINYLKIFRKYAALRPPNTEHRRFFIYYDQGKCSRQVIGKNTFGQLPKKIARFLNLPDIESYTGHGFKRSSASLSVVKRVIQTTEENFRFDNDPTSIGHCSSNEESLNVKEKDAVTDQPTNLYVKNETEDGSHDICEDSNFDFDDFETQEEDIFGEEIPLNLKKHKIDPTENTNRNILRKTDEISLFGELLMTKLRKLDTTTRMIVCNKIDNLLFETEMKSLNKRFKEDHQVQEAPSTSMGFGNRNLSVSDSPHYASSDN